MNPRLPRLTAREMQRLLERHGLRVVRQRGSHRILRDDFGRRVTPPIQSGKILHAKIITTITGDAGLTDKDLA